MPVIKSAKKKLRKDRKRTIHNKKIREAIKRQIKKAENLKTEDAVRKAISLINKAAKKNIFHKNKASRLTSRLTKLVSRQKTIRNTKAFKKVENK